MATNRANISDSIFETWLSVRFELLKHLKRRRLFILVALAILLPLFPLISRPDMAAEFATSSLSFVSVMIIISAAMFAGDAVCGEFERKTSLLLFPTPQKRSSIFAGKYVAALLGTFLIVSLWYLVMTLEIGPIYGWGEMPAELWKSFIVALVYSAAAVSVAFLVSSLLKRSMSATIVSFLVLVMILPIIAMILTQVNQEPWFIVTYSANLIANVLGVSSSVGSGMQEHFGSSTFKPDFGVGIAVMAAYAVIGFVSGAAIAIRKEE
jgi:ABC-2 type transport system permease protein